MIRGNLSRNSMLTCVRFQMGIFVHHRPLGGPTESSNPTQHAKGRTGDYPGPRKETTARGKATQGG